VLTASAEVVAGSDRNFYEEWEVPEINLLCLEACKWVATYIINKSLNIIDVDLLKKSLDNKLSCV